MSKLVYIGSPYSNPDSAVREENFNIVSRMAARECAKGKVAFSPITYGHTLIGFTEMPTNWEFWKPFCLAFLERADELLVYKMPGWDMSKGLAAEIEFAIERNITIRWAEYDEYENVPVEEKREFIRNSNEWEVSWSDDNWVRKNAANKEANTGIDTDSLYRSLKLKNQL
jgi:hypothetical protein